MDNPPPHPTMGVSGMDLQQSRSYSHIHNRQIDRSEFFVRTLFDSFVRFSPFWLSFLLPSLHCRRQNKLNGGVYRKVGAVKSKERKPILHKMTFRASSFIPKPRGAMEPIFMPSNAIHRLSRIKMSVNHYWTSLEPSHSSSRDPPPQTLLPRK